MSDDELLNWINAHAPLTQLCERGGWPDDTTLRMEVCSKADNEWIVDIYFIEAIQEISECDPTRTERCGKFSIHFDVSGHPETIQLLYPM